MVSEEFGFHEAVLFWNLRAAQVMVSWLTFSQFEKDLREICTWLDADFGGSFYTFHQDIAFSSSTADQVRLGEIFQSMVLERWGDFPTWRTCKYEQLAFYDYERPHIKRRHVPISRHAETCSFMPDYPDDIFGMLALTLEWPPLMMPRQRIVADLISPEKFLAWSTRVISGHYVPKFRITASRYSRMQLSDQSPVEFNVPPIEKVLHTLFDEAGFGQFQESSHAQYQRTFIERCGSLISAGYFLQNAPYSEFFALLSDCKKGSDGLGWLLKDPPERRALRQLDVCRALTSDLPKETEQYFNNAESLPIEAVQLLKLQLLERGFQISCSFCSSKSWYRADEVGQLFRCHRCYEEQKVISNPLWLYKLPEVIFQGFNNHMEVPLLALYYFLRKSRHNFQYALDSKVFWESGGNAENNLDFCCLSDGKVYVGEAKSNDYIEQDQFEFYEKLASKVSIDVIVFATSRNRWKPSTLDRIEALKAHFNGSVLVLTKSQLYEP